MNYDRIHKVKIWVIVDVKTAKKREKITKWFEKKDALIQPWPSLGYKDEVLKYNNKGYKIPDKKPYKISSSLILRSAVDTVKKTISQRSILVLDNRSNLFTANINTDDDYITLMDMILNTVDPLDLSQCFQIYERCVDRMAKKRYLIFMTPENGVKKILTKISENVIVISEDEDGDINLSNTSPSDISKELDTVFVNKISHLGI